MYKESLKFYNVVWIHEWEVYINKRYINLIKSFYLNYLFPKDFIIYFIMISNEFSIAVILVFGLIYYLSFSKSIWFYESFPA